MDDAEANSVQSPPKSISNGVSDSPQRSNSPAKISVNLSFKESSKGKSPSKTSLLEENIDEAISKLEPQGQTIIDHVEELTVSVNELSKSINSPQTSRAGSNIEKIAKMSKILTNEANSLRQSIKSLSEDIARTKQAMESVKSENVNFPYHLFLIELVVNKIHMKCECFELDYNNLVISATFLGKPPIVLYDSSYGKVESFSNLNVGKSTLFAMTYDKICSIKEFEVILQLTKEPPCSNCITKLAETRIDFTSEFMKLREELCKKWSQEKPHDNIICTTSTPLSKNLFYLSCCSGNDPESIGVIEVSCRMSFLGKEITTAFCTAPKPRGTSLLLKEENGVTMYSCQRVEMDDQGKILLDEDVLARKDIPCNSLPTRRTESPLSNLSTVPASSARSYEPQKNGGDIPKYDEIFTKMNENELKIRVPKSTRVERTAKYDKIQELCSCESTPYNTGDQVQFELPPDLCYPDKTHNTYTSNLKYTYKGCDRTCEKKDRKIINITPTNCPVPVNIEKVQHPQKDVFILKIGKKLETKDKKTDLEIELVTPKIPSDKPVENNNTVTTQSSNILLKSEKKEKGKNGKKEKDKKKSGGKGKKGGKKKK